MCSRARLRSVCTSDKKGCRRGSAPPALPRAPPGVELIPQYPRFAGLSDAGLLAPLLAFFSDLFMFFASARDLSCLALASSLHAFSSLPFWSSQRSLATLYSASA